MERRGWVLIVVGLTIAAASTVPFIYAVTTAADAAVSHEGRSTLMWLGSVLGLVVAAVGVFVLRKAHSERTPRV